ncbi:MAG: hypothetical protein ABL904_01740 [Hyphomicrobiaceae bacterium]
MNVAKLNKKAAAVSLAAVLAWTTVAAPPAVAAEPPMLASATVVWTVLREIGREVGKHIAIEQTIARVKEWLSRVGTTADAGDAQKVAALLELMRRELEVSNKVKDVEIAVLKGKIEVLQATLPATGKSKPHQSPPTNTSAVRTNKSVMADTAPLPCWAYRVFGTEVFQHLRGSCTE